MKTGGNESENGPPGDEWKDEATRGMEGKLVFEGNYGSWRL